MSTEDENVITHYLKILNYNSRKDNVDYALKYMECYNVGGLKDAVPEQLEEFIETNNLIVKEFGVDYSELASLLRV